MLPIISTTLALFWRLHTNMYISNVPIHSTTCRFLNVDFFLSWERTATPHVRARSLFLNPVDDEWMWKVEVGMHWAVYIPSGTGHRQHNRLCVLLIISKTPTLYRPVHSWPHADTPWIFRTFQSRTPLTCSWIFFLTGKQITTPHVRNFLYV